ncbi:hypothetical protein QM806_14275 [Rhodococcus sp. IEGM 1351]|uniref:hypothetical protein n=1 Tax=Rhodococcus sp. IEGM 1351 TaxID=3047089 RepID=UPI0024B810D3|nr:hypothetical protein [Rhodococcus sp. IEGM 1351]MDI9936585.1 hypothetical protein [Rhodococcus sp. IEGM 1351]
MKTSYVQPLWLRKLYAASVYAMNKLDPQDAQRRHKQCPIPCAALTDPGEMLRITWGYDENHEPLDFFWIGRNALMDDDISERRILKFVVTDVTFSDTVPEDWVKND